MKITKKSEITGNVNSMEINVTTEELKKLGERRPGEYIQNLLPKLTPDEREFLMTGITPEEWDKFIIEPND